MTPLVGRSPELLLAPLAGAVLVVLAALEPWVHSTRQIAGNGIARVLSDFSLWSWSAAPHVTAGLVLVAVAGSAAGLAAIGRGSRAARISLGIGASVSAIGLLLMGIGLATGPGAADAGPRFGWRTTEWESLYHAGLALAGIVTASVWVALARARRGAADSANRAPVIGASAARS